MTGGEAEPRATRLYPLPPREIPVESVYAELELPPAGWSHDARPYVIINMVSSLDGKTAIGGKAARIGGRIDRHTMRNLRSHADAVMIGANTLRAEKLSLGLDDPSDRPQPLAVIATTTGDLPLESNLIVGKHQKVLVITTQDAPEDLEDRLRHSARVLRAPATPTGAINLREVLRILTTEHGVELLLVEGGPSMNYALISQNLADEFFLTLAPKLLGETSEVAVAILGDGPNLPPIDAKLLSVYLAGSELFLRYAVS